MIHENIYQTFLHITTRLVRVNVNHEGVQRIIELELIKLCGDIEEIPDIKGNALAKYQSFYIAFKGHWIKYLRSFYDINKV